MSEGIVKIHGKEYKTVAHRIGEFTSLHKDWGINTEILHFSDDKVVIKAVVTDENGQVRGSGIAMEEEGSSNINKTSHVENCETSAIGRALASIGLAGTDSYASADEVANAISQQAVKEATEKLIKHNKAVSDNWDSVSSIKAGIAMDELSSCSESWFELEADVKSALWMAPSNGGVFTTKEREIIKSTEFRESYYGTETE